MADGKQGRAGTTCRYVQSPLATKTHRVAHGHRRVEVIGPLPPPPRPPLTAWLRTGTTAWKSSGNTSLKAASTRASLGLGGGPPASAEAWPCAGGGGVSGGLALGWGVAGLGEACKAGG